MPARTRPGLIAIPLCCSPRTGVSGKTPFHSGSTKSPGTTAAERRRPRGPMGRKHLPSSASGTWRPIRTPMCEHSCRAFRNEGQTQPLAPSTALLHAAPIAMKPDLLQPNPVCALLGLVFSLSVHSQEARLPAAPTSIQPTPSLRQKFANQFLVGVAVDGNPAQDYSRAERELIHDQFGALTPANCMKMIALQPEEGRFDFRLADAFVAFAQSNDLKACGHCLVWAKDERTPAWLFKAGTNVVSRDLDRKSVV